MLALVPSILFIPQVLAQEDDSESQPEPTGKLVVAPWTVPVGDTVHAMAFHVEPLTVQVKTTYSNHFAPDGTTCEETASGSTEAFTSWSGVILLACQEGTGQIQLIESESGNVIRTVEVPVTAAPKGARQVPRDDHPVNSLGVNASAYLGGTGSVFVSVARVDLESSGDSNFTANWVSLTPDLWGFDSACNSSSTSHSWTWPADLPRKDRKLIAAETFYGCAVGTGSFYGYLTRNGWTIRQYYLDWQSPHSGGSDSDAHPYAE